MLQQAMGGGSFYVPMFRAKYSFTGRASPLYTCSSFALRCPSLSYQALLSLFLSKGLTVYTNTTRTRKAESAGGNSCGRRLLDSRR